MPMKLLHLAANNLISIAGIILILLLCAGIYWLHREQTKMDEKLKREGKPLYWF